jgi:DNA repair exonuclease SbcCD ATPase subunit
MKQIKLISIHYHNFKGLTDYTLSLNGDNAAVAGKNATGKTTLFDGFLWLLFGKNSDEAAKFNAKPLDDHGNEKLGLEPLVEATIEVDGTQVALKRVSEEVWSKPKGKLERQRKSDTTVLYVDGVPKKVREYQDYISTLINEDTFKLLTNPLAFNNLHWKKRREILFQLVDDVEDDDVIKSNQDLKELTKILNGHSVADQLKVIEAQRKQIKKDINSVPDRIDEATRAQPELSSTDKSTLEAIQKDYQDSLAKAQQELQLAQTVGDTVEVKAQIADISNKIIAEQSSFLQANNMLTAGLVDDINTQQYKVNEAQQAAITNEQIVNQLQQQYNAAEEQRKLLLEKYHREKSITFDDDQMTCPTCGQDLPADKVAEHRDKFNQEHSDKLAKLIEQGKDALTRRDKYADEYHDSETRSQALSETFNQERDRSDALKAELAKTKAEAPKFEETDEYRELQQQKADLQLKLDNASSDNAQAVAGVQQRIDEIDAGIKQVQGELAKFDQVIAQQKRVEELKQEELKLKQKYEDLDKQVYLLDQFTRAKASMMTEKINTKFKLVTFKLFDVLKTGDTSEICETLVDGVPYSTDLNNAAKINGGLDIINTLSDFYQVTAPIFVDNAESVNQLLPTDAQRIALLVSDDEKLKVVS